MNERRRPPRRGRGSKPYQRPADENGGEDNPYRNASGEGTGDSVEPVTATEAPLERPPRDTEGPPGTEGGGSGDAGEAAGGTTDAVVQGNSPTSPQESGRDGGYGGGHRFPHQNGRRGRRNRGRGRRDPGQATEPPQGGPPPAPGALGPTGETTGWFDPARDGGFVRRAQGGALAEKGGGSASPPHRAPFRLRRSRDG